MKNFSTPAVETADRSNCKYERQYGSQLDSLVTAAALPPALDQVGRRNGSQWAKWPDVTVHNGPSDELMIHYGVSLERAI